MSDEDTFCNKLFERTDQYVEPKVIDRLAAIRARMSGGYYKVLGKDDAKYLLSQIDGRDAEIAELRKNDTAWDAHCAQLLDEIRELRKKRRKGDTV